MDIRRRISSGSSLSIRCRKRKVRTKFVKSRGLTKETTHARSVKMLIGVPQGSRTVLLSIAHFRLRPYSSPFGIRSRFPITQQDVLRGSPLIRAFKRACIFAASQTGPQSYTAHNGDAARCSFLAQPHVTARQTNPKGSVFAKAVNFTRRGGCLRSLRVLEDRLWRLR